MKRTLRVLIGSAAVIVLTVGFSGNAEAATINPCPASFTTSGTTDVKVYSGANVTASSACQYLTPADPSNVASIANINAAGFFGFSDWESAGVVQAGGAGNEGSSGTWAIPVAFLDFAAYDYTIVFKDGNNTNLVAFLLNETASSGLWRTPFTEPPFSFPGAATQRDVSHLTIARRATNGTGGDPVPEPTSLALFGLALLGAGIARRRRP